jgi:Cupin-like domain
VTHVQGRASDTPPDAGRSLPGPLTSWTVSQAASLTSNVVRTSHRLGELDLFTDDELAGVLDRHPRKKLQAFTMGTDLVRDEWIPVEVGSATGLDMLAAVRTGRLWLNVLDVDRAHDSFSQLQARLFDELAATGFDVLPGTPHSALLISSPDAMVSYHADAGPNVLWHIRGDKRIWIYPAGNERFVEPALLEDIFVGVRTENLPYDPEFDAAALTFDLHAGDLISWPQNSPHRVQNLGSVNVSLSSEFDTANSRRRHLVYAANRFYSRKVHLPMRSTRETGAAAATKRFTYRAFRKMGFDRTRPSYVQMTQLRIDPGSPGGVTALAEPVRAAFSAG